MSSTYGGGGGGGGYTGGGGGALHPKDSVDYAGGGGGGSSRAFDLSSSYTNLKTNVDFRLEHVLGNTFEDRTIESLHQTTDPEWRITITNDTDISYTKSGSNEISFDVSLNQRPSANNIIYDVSFNGTTSNLTFNASKHSQSNGSLTYVTSDFSYGTYDDADKTQTNQYGSTTLQLTDNNTKFKIISNTDTFPRYFLYKAKCSGILSPARLITITK